MSLPHGALSWSTVCDLGICRYIRKTGPKAKLKSRGVSVYRVFRMLMLVCSIVVRMKQNPAHGTATANSVESFLGCTS